MQEYYDYIKALHLIFIITWFAGLFYVVRLFVYHAETEKKESPEKEILIKQYRLMTYRLWYIITWPSAVLATIFAVTMLCLRPVFLSLGYMHVKFAFVFLLFLYHAKCHQFFLQLQKGTSTKTSGFFRLWNEGATIILFAVVFIIIVRDAINWIYGVVGIMVFSILLMLGYKFYKRIRERNNQ
jgi:protoporphyrinogen IX oxidase